MNQAVTFGVNKSGGKLTFTVISDPNVPHGKQRRKFRHLRRELHGKFDEVQLWTSSGGRVKRQRTVAAVLAAITPAVVPVVVPVQEPVSSQDAAALLDLGETTSQQPVASTDPVAPATVSSNSGGQSTSSPTLSEADAKKAKRAQNLAKAQAASAAKRAAKAKPAAAK